MKEPTPEEIEALEVYAPLLFSDNDLAAIIGWTREDFRLAMKMENNRLFHVVTKARLLSEASIRRSILDMAERSSTPAQHMAEELLRQMKRDNA